MDISYLRKRIEQGFMKMLDRFIRDFENVHALPLQQYGITYLVLHLIDWSSFHGPGRGVMPRSLSLDIGLATGILLSDTIGNSLWYARKIRRSYT